MPLKGLRIEGNSRQNGVPEPTTKVDYLSSGENGSISIIKSNENVAITNLELGTISSTTGKNQSNANTVRTVGYIDVSTASEWTFTRVGDQSNMKTRYYDRNYEYLGYTPQVGGAVTRNLAVPEGAAYVRFSADSNTDLSYFTKYQVSLRPSDNSTTYVENKYKTYSIEAQQPMRSIGNIRDCFEKVNGVWYEKHKIGHVLLDGTQAWVLYSGAFYTDVTLNYLKQSGTTCACDQYLGVNNVIGGSAAYDRGNNTISLYIPETYNRIYLRDDRFTAPADLAAWFTQNNAHFYYIMNEEIVLPCTTEQTAQLEEIINDGAYENTTYYWGTDTVSPVFDVTYYQQMLPLAENHCDEYIDQQITQAIGGAY